MSNLNKQAAIDIHQAFSSNQFDRVLSMCSDDVEANAYAMGMNFKGKDGFSAFMQGFKSAFPDVTIEHRNMVADGDRVAVEFVARGTHTGTLQTPAGAVPPTGRPIELIVSEFMTWENGKLKSLNNYQDAGSLMRQLGLLNG